MADKLGLGSEVRELKLGPSFTNKKSTAFHTLKYDFKPASVDVSKMAQVDVGSNNTMTVTVPHSDGAGTPHTVFKGSQRAYNKECVLIIDRVTGEITLEKLSSNIQVKKTRTEPKSQAFLSIPGNNSGNSNSNTASNNNNRPFTPVETRKSPTHGRANGRTKVTSGKKKEPTVQLHPKQHSPSQASPYHGKSPPNLSNNSCSPVPPPLSNSMNPSTLASLPMIGLDADDYPISSMSSVSSTSLPPVAQQQQQHQQQQQQQQLTQSGAPPRTEIQQSTTNGGGQTFVRERIVVDDTPITNIRRNQESDEGALSDSSSSSSSSDSSDSDSDAENTPVPMPTNGHSNGLPSPSLSMPANLLKDDLQLSESGSDSD